MPFARADCAVSVLIGLALGLVSCGSRTSLPGAQTEFGPPELGELNLPTPVPLGLDLFVPLPADNPATPDKLELGRELFFDTRLSRDGTVACATCHEPDRAFSSAAPLAVGVDGRQGRRNAPTLVNRAYGRRQFWDGRAASIEEQILATVQSTTEMDMTLPELERRLAAVPKYRNALRASFADGVTATNIARAIAVYVRSIRAGDAPVDRYVFGNTAALSPLERRGMTLFNGEGNCWLCHSGPNFSDDDLHNTGVSWLIATGAAAAETSADRGRFEVTGDASDLGRFKTPTLRNVDLTGPYMHDGSIATLEEVIEFYDRGGNANPNLDPLIRPLRLATGDKTALAAFLRSLTSPTIPY
jgi:cytochrome c peroxidase